MKNANVFQNTALKKTFSLPSSVRIGRVRLHTSPPPRDPSPAIRFFSLFSEIRLDFVRIGGIVNTILIFELRAYSSVG